MVARGGQAPAQAEQLADLLQLHARVLRRMPLFQLALVAAIGWMALPSVPVVHFAVWAALAIVVEGMRAYGAHWLLRGLPRVASARVRWLFIALDVLSGAVLAVAALWFVPFMPLLWQVLLETILYTVAAAGSAVTISGTLMPEAYSTAVLLGASTSWVLRAPQQFWVVAMLTVVLWLFLWMLGRESRHLLQQAGHIRHEKDQALASLERSDAELRDAYAKIERGVRARSRVMAAASHDLRQPLQALSVYSAILAAQPPSEVTTTLGTSIEQLVRDLGHILDELLDLSSLTAVTFNLAPEPTDLYPLVGQICAGFHNAVAAKGLRIDEQLQPAALVVDRYAFGRIVRNLIDNAVKFTDHGSVRVSLEQTGEVVMLAIEDSGCGIPAGAQHAVFEEFCQLDADHSRRLGIGLGLTIVSKLCELTGGTLTLRSQLGVGSCFAVAWPRNTRPLANTVAAAE